MKRSLPFLAAFLLGLFVPAAAFSFSYKPFHPKPHKVKRHKPQKH